MFSNPEAVFGGTGRLLEVIETIYEAVQRPELWPVVMERIAEAVQGESTMMFARFPEEQLFAAARTDPGAWEAYAGYYSSVNVLMERCDRMFADGTVRYSQLAMEPAELARTEFYNDFFHPHGMHHSFGLKIPLGGELPPAYLSCQRPRDSQPFGETEGQVYLTLLPHLQRALGLHLQMTGLKASVQGLESALDAFQHAVFGVDRHCRVVLSNREAEAIVRQGDVLRLMGGRLGCARPEQQQRLQAAMAAAVSTGDRNGTAAGGAALLERAGKGSLRVSVTPFTAALPRTSCVLAALVFVTDPGARTHARGGVLRALYGLTPMEARVADALLAGGEMRSIAEALGLTLETTRFHTKRILAKTGARRQSELMKLMLSLPRL